MEKKSFKSFDGKTVPYLFFESTRKDLNSNIIIFHGILEHVYRYTEFGDFLSANGYNVYIMELRGHGELREGEYADFGKDGIQELYNDMNDFFEILESEGEITRNNTVVFGHSMGALLAVKAVIEKKYRNLIISGFPIQKKFISYTGSITSYLERMLVFKKKSIFNNQFRKYNSYFEPSYSPNDWLTRDTAEADRYSEDENCGYYATPKYFSGIFKTMNFINRNYKKMENDTRILTVYGTEDKCINIEYINKILSKLKRKKRRIHVIANENGRHESLNEINKYVIYDEILKWLKEVIK